MQILYLGSAYRFSMLEEYFKPERKKKIMFTWMVLSERKECKKFNPVHLGERGCFGVGQQDGSLG